MLSETPEMYRREPQNGAYLPEVRAFGSSGKVAGIEGYRFTNEGLLTSGLNVYTKCAPMESDALPG